MLIKRKDAQVVSNMSLLDLPGFIRKTIIGDSMVKQVEVHGNAQQDSTVNLKEMMARHKVLAQELPDQAIPNAIFIAMCELKDFVGDLNKATRYSKRYDCIVITMKPREFMDMPMDTLEGLYSLGVYYQYDLKDSGFRLMEV